MSFLLTAGAAARMGFWLFLAGFGSGLLIAAA